MVYFCNLFYPILSLQFLVFNPVHLIRFVPQAFFAVGFIILKIAVKPGDLAIPFKREDMGSHSIQKPAVVADDDGASNKIFKSDFQSA